MVRIGIVLFCLVVAGCAGTLNYTPPAAPPRIDNSKTIDRPREAVWNAAVPALSRQFFVINNLDKSSGFINLSYSGNPEAYVDCGRVVSYVKNARGERTYDFPGAVADQSYETLNPNGLFFVYRKMSLEGRMNLIFEEAAPDKTRVSVTTRYVLTRSIEVRPAAGGATQTRNDSISFNTGSGAAFPGLGGAQALECVPLGQLERELLYLIN